MAKIVLISCVSKKLEHRSKAEKMYISPLFKYNLKYAKSMNPANIYILSAKYGLLNLDQEIEPYDLILNKMKSSEVEKWADKVFSQLEQITDTNNDEFIFLAGEKYRKYLIPKIKNYKIPLKGLGIGKQLKFLKEHTK